MAGIRIPSLQHLVRNWRDEPRLVEKSLVRLADDPPRFSYNPLFGAVYDLLVLKVPYEQVVAGVTRIKREKVRDNLLGALPLIRDHFEDVHPDFFQSVERRYYPAGRGLMVPFDPPLIYGVGGQLYFPWFSFWRANPLSAERLSLFVTLVEEVLLQDPDLEGARFKILDFSVPRGESTRSLLITDARFIERIADKRKAEMLDIFAEGYFKALDTLARRAHSDEKRPDPANDPDQPYLPGM